MSRTVTLILIDDKGRPRGTLPPFAAQVPWWPEVWDVVAGAREHYGVDVTVLRILATEPGLHHGGAVTYAGVDLGRGSRRHTSPGVDLGHSAPSGDQLRALSPRSTLSGLEPASVPANLSPRSTLGLDRDHPLRMAYARPGGPAASLSWAARALDAAGRGPLTGAEQRRTWNLSAIWRLQTPAESVWLKEVPPFFAHEAAVLAWLAGAGFGRITVPLLASNGTRMLLAHIAGDDLHDVELATRLGIAADMHAIGVRASGDIGSLLDAGVPDRRAPRLAEVVAAVVAEHGGGDDRLHRLLDGLDERLASVAACGLPDTLVHGDLHPGNVRGDGQSRVIIDWGDASITHPVFDILRLAEGLTDPDAAELVAFWARLWREAVPGSDPVGAVALLRPVAALRNAATYAHFLANIEPDEHRYHAADVGFWLGQAAASGDALAPRSP